MLSVGARVPVGGGAVGRRRPPPALFTALSLDRASFTRSDAIDRPITN
jgi:hypothetical protein